MTIRSVSVTQSVNMTNDLFRFNSEAKYHPGVQATDTHSASSLIKARIQVQLAQGKWFEAQYPDVREKYRLPLVSSDKLVQAWQGLWRCFADRHSYCGEDRHNRNPMLAEEGSYALS